MLVDPSFPLHATQQAYKWARRTESALVVLVGYKCLKAGELEGERKDSDIVTSLGPVFFSAFDHNICLDYLSG